MSLLLIESFDGYGNTPGVAPAGVMSNTNRWTLGASLSTNYRLRTGRVAGLGLEPAAITGLNTVSRNFGAQSSIVCGFGIFFYGSASAHRFFEFRDGASTVQGCLTLSTGNLIQYGTTTGVVLGTGTTVINDDTWYYIEIKINSFDNSNGSVEIRVDGVTDLTLTNIDTLVTNATVDRINFRTDSSARNYVVDDVYVLNTSGSVNNDFLGECVISCLLPQADIQAQWTPSTGSSNFDRVNEPGTITSGGGDEWVDGSTDALDLYEFPQYTGSGNIGGIQIDVVANVQTGSPAFNTVIQSNGTNYNQSLQSLPSPSPNYILSPIISQTDPATSSPWLKADFNNSYWGINKSGAAPTAVARVRRFSLEFLTYGIATTIVTAEASSAMTLSQDILLQGVIPATASSSLGLTQTADPLITGPPIEESASSDLALTDYVDYAGPIDESVEDEIVFTETLNRVIDLEITDELELVSDGQNITIISYKLPEGMYPGGFFNPIALPLDETEVLRLLDTVLVVAPRRASASSDLGLSQTVSVRQAVINKTVVDLLSFSQGIKRTIDASAASSLTLTDEVERRWWESSDLVMSDNVSGFASKVVRDSLALSDILNINFERSFDLDDTILFGQSALVLLSNDGRECLYSPQVGVIGSGITPPPLTKPTIGTATLTLSYPATSPTTTVVLKNPQFGNIDRLNYMRIKANTRGGKLLIYADPMWPKEQVQVFEIVAMPKQMADDFKIFLAESLGQEINLLDHENRNWRGIITTPDADFTHVGNCNYTVSFEFEGVLV